MFIVQKSFSNVQTDASGRELLTTTQTVYLFDGQEPNDKILHPDTQKYYKKLFKIQEDASVKNERPTCILEALGFGL